jgi:hypothetical protein
MRPTARSAARCLRRAVDSVWQSLRPQPVDHLPRPRLLLSDPLEPRRLLVTLGHGDTFFYNTFDYEDRPTDANDFVVAQIAVQGDPTANTTVETTAATLDRELGELSGFITRADGTVESVLGGLGGVVGAQPLVPTAPIAINRTDLLDFDNNGGTLTAPQTVRTAFSELDTNSLGETFGLQIYDEDPFGPHIDVVIFNTDPTDLTKQAFTPGIDDPALGDAADAVFLGNIVQPVLDLLNANAATNPQAFQNLPELVSGIPPEPLTFDAIDSSFGFAFEPSANPNTAYLGLNITTRRENPASTSLDDQFVDAPVPVILSLTFDPTDRTNITVDFVASDFSADEELDAAVTATLTNFTITGGGAGGGGGGGSTIPEFVFTGTFRERLFENTDAVVVEETEGIVKIVSPSGRVDDEGLRDRVRELNIFGDSGPFIDLDYRPQTNEIYGLTGPGEDQELHRFDNFGSGGGDAIDTQFTGGTQAAGLGSNNQLAFTYDSLRLNPFTGDIGGFLTFDVDSDILYELDTRPRGVGGALSLYNLTVNNGDADSTIIRTTARTTNEDDSLPTGFEGDPGVLQVFGDEEITIEAADGTRGSGGELYLGMKFTDDDNFVNYGQIPFSSLIEGTAPYDGPLVAGAVVPGVTMLDGGVQEFTYGGVVTGRVRIEGSIDLFAAGAILTGAVAFDGPAIQDNFAVFGDVGTIVSTSHVGDNEMAGARPDYDEESTDLPAFASGTDFAIGGRVGTIRSAGSMVGAFDIRGDRDPEPGFATFYEARGDTYNEFELQIRERPEIIAAAFVDGRFDLPAFENDSFDTFEPLPLSVDGNVTVNGGLNSINDATDFVDYYGLPLMAGQEVVFSESVDPFGLTTLGVFDPEGRLVLTFFEDNSNTAAAVDASRVLYRAETAGTYRIAVGFAFDPTFSDGNAILFENTADSVGYSFRVEGAGDVALGAIQARQRIFTNTSLLPSFFDPGGYTGTSIRLRQGDIGVIEARAETIVGSGSIRTDSGHIRHVTGSSIGRTGIDVPVRSASEGVILRASFSVGRVEATGAAGLANPDIGGDVVLNPNDLFDGRVGTNFLGQQFITAGDDIQVVDAARHVWGQMIAGRGIGSIVAGDSFFTEGAFLPAAIFTNSDDLGDDGFVDILSVGDSIGSDTPLGPGPDTDVTSIAGPAIDMGTNGNFRYMDLPEGGVIVRDALFGRFPSESFQPITPGESFTFTDDSGTNVRLDPTPLEFNPNFNPAFDPPEAQFLNPGSLQVITYPVRSGGAILASVRADRGVNVTTADRGPRATAEIGNIFLSGDGRPVVRERDAFTFNAEAQLVLANTSQSADDPFNENDPFDDIDVVLNGANVDVFSVGAASGVTPEDFEIAGLASRAGDGRFSNIVNNTRGEVLNVLATSIGTIRAERVGVAETRGTAALEVSRPRIDLPLYPADNEQYAIVAENSIVSVEGDAVGNVYAGVDTSITSTPIVPVQVVAPTSPISDFGDGIGGLNGSVSSSDGRAQFGGGIDGVGLVRLGEVRGNIGSVRADAFGGDRTEFDNTGAGRDLDFRFEGIVGPIVAATVDTPIVEGQIDFVDIGEGIADDGSGNSGGGGLYAEAFIGRVEGNNANIYGDIVAAELGSVQLNLGSIIGADIIQTGQIVNDPSSPTFFSSREFQVQSTITQTLFETAEFEGQPFYEADLISVNGGGILGSRFEFNDIDTVRVTNGFGILRSDFGTTGDGFINNITTDGLGIRNVDVRTGFTLNNIVALGNADPIDVSVFSPTLLQSGDPTMVFDPATGAEISLANDLRYTVGLPPDVDSRRRITNDGVMENIRLFGSRDLGNMAAAVARSNITSAVPPGLQFEDSANGIGGGDPLAESFPLRVDFGRTLNNFDFISVDGFSAVGGDLETFDSEENLFNTSLRTSGRIQNVSVGDTIDRDTVIRAEGPEGTIGNISATDLSGIVRADRRIDEITLTGNLGGPDTIPAELTSTEATVRVGGSLGLPDSSIGVLRVEGDVLSGAFVRATDDIEELFVGGDVLDGAVIEAARIEEFDVQGTIFGDVLGR